MVTKQRGRRSTRSTVVRQESDTKFHGYIQIVPPDGPFIAEGSWILVTIRSLKLGNLPDVGINEICLVVSAETDKGAEPGQVSGSLKVEMLKYLQDGATLNIEDLVVLSAKVNRQLTLRCSIDELDASDLLIPDGFHRRLGS